MDRSNDLTLGGGKCGAFPLYGLFRNARPQRVCCGQVIIRVEKVTEFCPKYCKGFGKWVAHPNRTFWEYTMGKNPSLSLPTRAPTRPLSTLTK